MTRIISGWLAAAVLCLATSHAAAIGPSEVIASTFGPGDAYNGNAAFYIQYFPPDVSSPTGYQLAHAVRFQPSLADYVLETTRLSIFRRFNSGDLPRVTISAADAGGGPGAAAASKTIGGLLAAGASPPRRAGGGARRGAGPQENWRLRPGGLAVTVRAGAAGGHRLDGRA